MNFGWIDFSQNERNKTLEILDNLTQPGTLDELGIGYIRDKFSNIFFPGTSTLQSRAKYFLVVPYIIKDVLDKHKGNMDIKDILDYLNKAEEEFARKVLDKENGDTENLIGKNALQQGKWVQKKPSYIYWSGIKSYKIIDTDLSLYNYILYILNDKTNNSFSFNKKEDIDIDDDKEFSQNYAIKPYCKNWLTKEDIDLSLTKKEAEYLKNQIIQTHENSLIAHILKNKKRMKSFKEVESFDALIDDLIPEHLKQQYDYAIQFSNFVYALYIIYNLVVTNNNSKYVTDNEYKKLEKIYTKIADIDLSAMYDLLEVDKTDSLCVFLNKAKNYMQVKNIKELKKLICMREIALKQDRAKCKNKDKNNPEQWYGGEKLNYRFYTARMIIKDIYNGLEK
ncbi:MAG: DUF6361 family protein [Mucispirillum sp.]|nr:DUF6361 family protein [Mucispirillum sp.]